ncbi:tubulin epsilon and delta complex protein 1 [Embiotoca jacksoni]|uniref:tubulin epsilon and delta complex protein 1 n=1 Tax=Embiotoca jacksoni TaxID=100190 RepID=UPI003704B5DD
MRRSEASVSVEIKQVIGALCRLLTATGLDAVPAPESFRRAKFGGGREEDQFWQILANILQTTGIVSLETSSQLRGDGRKLVAAGLWQTGYHADWMYVREGGEGEERRSLSSRDLLLALGWLLATETLEKLLTQRVQQLDKSLLASIPVNLQLSNELQLEPASLSRLQWLIGCLRHQGRSLLSALQERTQMLHAVISASPPLTGSSVSDQSSAVLKEDCASIRQLCDLLEAYLNWKQVENIFWTWMDSVVDCHLTDPVVKRPIHAPNGRSTACHHMNRGLEKLEDMLLRLPTAQEGQRRRRGDVKDREVGTRLQAGSGASPVPPLLSSLPYSPSLTRAYRARLRAEKPVRQSRPPAEGPRSRPGAPDDLEASQAAELLLHAEALLLERRNRQRQANRMQLQDMIGRLDELVLMPP